MQHVVNQFANCTKIRLLARTGMFDIKYFITFYVIFRMIICELKKNLGLQMRNIIYGDNPLARARGLSPYLHTCCSVFKRIESESSVKRVSEIR